MIVENNIFPEKPGKIIFGAPAGIRTRVGGSRGRHT